jgi:hypothetical protein
MLRRRQINGHPGERARRFLLRVGDVAAWPFERVAWAAERALLWPLQERLAGWGPSGRGAGAAALAGVAAAGILGGILLLPGGDGGTPEPVVAPAPVAATAPEPRPQSPESEGPVLQGVAPSFGVGKGVGVARSSGDAGSELNAGSSSGSATTTGGETGGATESDSATGAATASAAKKKPVPAGPAAMKVARRFSEAFVLYEVGKRPARAKAVFAETATPQLAAALEERPPRQPEQTAVPKARVLNLVPGPRAGKAYTVSASLLRVGLTSELRLELSKKKGQWFVTDVRG